MVYGELEKGQIVMWMKDKEVEEEIERREWSGGLGNYEDDYLYIVETNLGANKANCCIDREVRQEIENGNEKLEIRYKNNNEFQNPKPPVFWGGEYVNYLRVIIPAGAEVGTVRVDGKM